MLATLARLVEERRKLGVVRALPRDVAERRESAARRLEVAERGRRPLADEVRRLEERLDELQVSPELAALPDDVVAVIDDGLGRHRAASNDLPKRRTAHAHAMAEVERSRAALGLAADLELEDVELDTTARARVRALADRHAELAADQRLARAAHAEALEAQARARARLASLGTPPDTARLAACWNQAARELERDARQAAARREHEAQRAELERRWARLVADGEPSSVADPTLDGSLAALVQRPWPEGATVEALVATDRDRRAEEHRARERGRELDERERDLDEEFAAWDAAGRPPSEDDLARARAARDRALDERTERSELARLVRAADEIADRLRHEARRIERYAGRVAAKERLASEREEVRAEERRCARRRDELERRWRELWQPCGIAPRSFAEASRWYAALVALEADARAWLAHGRELADVAATRERVRTELVAALGERADDAEDLAEACARAERVVHDAERRREAARALRSELDEAEAVLERRAARAAEIDERVASWRAEWSAALEPLRRGADEEPHVVLALVDGYGELARKVERADDLARRVAGMERDSQAFESLVRDRVARHAPDLVERAERSLADAAAELVRRQRDLRRDERERAAVAERLAEREAELAAHEDEIARARAELADLLASTGAADLDELVRLEDRWRRANELDERRAAEELRILQAGDGASIDALARAVEALDADAQRSRLLEIEAELQQVDDELEQASRQLALSEAGLEHFRESSAPKSAEEAEAALSVVRTEARRYACARLGAVLLGREIERYRQENQGPILARADELFPHLTLGRYRGLRVAFDAHDVPVLRCLRGDDEVGVDELSDGARDQLYLALRVASIERHAAHHEPVPFVRDDCLVHFDDELARAALDVLAELADRTQVLFFTHHARLVELAEATPGTTHVQSLDARVEDPAR